MSNILNAIKNKLCPSPVTIVSRSNIIQSDDMGYPLQLCIMSDGSQQWFDVDLEWAKKGIEDGSLKLLEWNRTII